MLSAFSLRIFSASELSTSAAHTMGDHTRNPVDSTDTNLDELDTTKFYVYGGGMYTAMTVMLHPVLVVKTRLQVVSPVDKNVYSIIKGILKTDGIPGLFKGLSTACIGYIPARLVYIRALEKSKAATSTLIEPLRLSQPTHAAVANGVGGLIASLCSQTISLPVDVVSQRLMVQGYSGHATYGGGLDVVRKIIKSDGIRGLYRGFGLTVMAHSPASAVIWASYGASQRIMWRLLGHGTESSETDPSASKIFLVQASGAISAAALGVCISTPLDTLKTRFQVIEHGKKPTIKKVFTNLIAEEGWTGLYRGFGPRFLNSSLWVTSLIMGYEYLKRTCAVKK